MKKIRKILKKNEVYFTTLSTLLLSAMAIIVSTKSCEISNSQYEMDYFENHPDFQIKEEYIFNKKTQKYENVQLVLSKLSGKAKNIEMETITFLDIEYSTYKDENKFKRFKITDYYNTSVLTGSNEGIILTELGFNNNSLAIKFENELETLLETNYRFVYIQTKSYAKIDYLNFERKFKTEYYDVSSTSGKLINNDTLSKYFVKDSKLFNSQNSIQLNHSEDLHKILSKF